MNPHARTDVAPVSFNNRAANGGPSKHGEAITSISALVPALWKELPALLDDVCRALRSIDRDYADFLAEQRPMVTAAAHVAIRELVETAEQRLTEDTDPFEDEGDDPSEAEPEGEDGLALALFKDAGRDHFRRNRPLLPLLLAYQTGGRVAWRHIAASAVRLEMPADTLAALAEGVFRAVDRISAVSTNGYLLEQAESAGMREQLLTALAERLVVEGADPSTLQELAQQAGWPLPAEAAIVVVRHDDKAAPGALARLAPPCLHVRFGAFPGLIMPDPSAPGARKRLSTALRGCSAVVGPTVPLRELPESVRVTLDAAWVWETSWGGQRPFFVDEHLDAIIVHRDERLLDALRARCLAPLEGASRSSRAAFQDTLRSWLVHMGDRRAIAAELQVHPQTVRYRMNRLHELFGSTLDDPDARLRLLLALAWDDPVGERHNDRDAGRRLGEERPAAPRRLNGLPRPRIPNGMSGPSPSTRRTDAGGISVASPTEAWRR
jgi:PucR C-terminal helix-turn-helix domain